TKRYPSSGGSQYTKVSLHCCLKQRKGFHIESTTHIKPCRRIALSPHRSGWRERLRQDHIGETTCAPPGSAPCRTRFLVLGTGMGACCCTHLPSAGHQGLRARAVGRRW